MATQRSSSSLFDATSATVGFFWAIGLVILQWIMVAVFSWQLPPQIPLFFTLPEGRTQLVERGWIFLLPLVSVLIVLINWILFRLLTIKLKVFAYLLSWLTALLMFLMAVAMGHVIILAL